MSPKIKSVLSVIVTLLIVFVFAAFQVASSVLAFVATTIGGVLFIILLLRVFN